MLCHPPGQFTNLGNVLPGDPELQWIAHRRAVFQPRHTGTDHGEIPVKDLFQPIHHLFPFLDIARQNNELGHRSRRQFLVQGQVITGGTTAHVTHVVFYQLILSKHGFQTKGLLLGGGERGTLLQLHVYHQFQPTGRREELLGHQAEQQ